MRKIYLDEIERICKERKEEEDIGNRWEKNYGKREGKI